MVWLFCNHPVFAQHLSFNKVNTSRGLSDNLVYDAVKDNTGLLWIATAAGLNTFDGFKVKEWNEVTDHWLHTRDIRDLWADPSGNVWVVGANSRMLWLDAFRRPHLLQYRNQKDSGHIRFIFPQPSTGHMYLLVDRKLMLVKKGTEIIEKIADLPDSLMRNTFNQESAAGPNHYLITGANRVLLLSLNEAKIKKVWPIKRAICAMFQRNGRLLVTTEFNRQLFVVDTQTNKVSENLGLLTDQNNRPVNGYLRYMSSLPDGRVAITSGYGGLYILDVANKKIWNYAHNPLEAQSISGNNTYRIRSTADGFLFITTRSSGLNIVHTRLHQVLSVKNFIDPDDGRIFDGFVGSFSQDKNGTIWLGSQGGLFTWNGKNKEVKFKQYGEIEGEPIAGKEEVRALYTHTNGTIWVGLNRWGAVVLNKQGDAIKYFSKDQIDSTQKLPSNFILHISQLPKDELIWVATSLGLRFIDPITMKIVHHPQQSLLDSFNKIGINQIWAKDQNEVWIASNRGAWKWQPLLRKLTQYGQKNGLKNTIISSIAGDTLGNIYAAGRAGVDVISPQAQVRNLSRKNGLFIDACQSVVADNNGRIWIGNTNHLVAIDPVKNSLRSFDFSYGFLGNGFRVQAAFRLSNHQLLFGCNEGIVVFDPNQLWKSEQEVQVWISGCTTSKTHYYFTGNAKLNFTADEASPVFTFQAIALQGLQTIGMQYNINGQEDGWKEPGAGGQVVTNNLPPGQYQLQLRFHSGNGQWKPAKNAINFSIATHWYRKLWFVALVSLFTGGVMLWLAYLWITQRKFRREESETEKAVLQLSQTLHEHQNIDAMLWALATQSIARLQLEDCVIYLVDQDRNMLQQQAAFGPKQINGQQVVAPIEIPIGKGIVGYAAQNATTVLVPDTRLDARYIVDDQPRLSELAVPIISEGKVLGVIDSEHSKRSFFTPRHVAIFTTMASVLGSKMSSMRAAEEKNSAVLALLENKQRTSEVEMQALRAQMNPHFMFNSLNSINNFILKNDADNASAYLTRFARLMRLILDNSRLEWVSLHNELMALQLYIEMECLRFDNVFAYHIQIDKSVEPMSVLVPPMIIQPYVENAIWHGLLHRKEEGSELLITVSLNQDVLCICIEDNGIGRTAAEAMKSKFGTYKQSHGMQITAERLQIVNDVYGIDAKAVVADRTDIYGNATGTKVVLTMKCKKNESSNH